MIAKYEKERIGNAYAVTDGRVILRPVLSFEKAEQQLETMGRVYPEGIPLSPRLEHITALESELSQANARIKELESAQEWRPIDTADPSTFPAGGDWYEVSVIYADGNTAVYPAWYDSAFDGTGGDWMENDYSGKLLLPRSGRVYAYRALPAPAPFTGHIDEIAVSDTAANSEG